MVRLTSPNSSGYQTHFVSPRAIARITEAGTSSQWHGIRSIVMLFDGEKLECSESADDVRRMLESEGGTP